MTRAPVSWPAEFKVQPTVVPSAEAEPTLAPGTAPQPTPAPQAVVRTPAPAQPATQTGELEVRVTDAPPDGVSNIVITISKIQVHKAGSDEADDASWIPIIEEERTFDLVLITGIEEVLGTKELSAGKYTQIRMDVVSVDVTLQPRGETDFVTRAAEVPGDTLKVVRPFDVLAGETTVLTLDFDAAKSVVVTGRGDVRFKPVVKLFMRKGPRTDSSGRRGAQGGQDAEEAGAPPEITVTGVSGGDQSTEPITLEFGVTDDVDAESDLTVTATLNGEPFTSGTVVSELGEYALKVTAVDADGNEAEVEVEFEIVGGR